MVLLVLAFVGGAFGAIARELIVLLSPAMDSGFPLGILIVNCIGSLLLGVAVGHYRKEAISHELHHLFGVGVMGGMTTFSTFIGDALQGLMSGRITLSLLYLLLSIVLGYVAVWAGLGLAYGYNQWLTKRKA